MGGAYLAAADASELTDINGAMTVLCGYHPTDASFDPYTGLVGKLGEVGARDYLQALYDRSQQWVDEAGYGNVAESLKDKAETGSGMQVQAAIDTIDSGSRSPRSMVLGVGVVAALLVATALHFRAHRGRAGPEDASQALLAAKDVQLA